MVGWARARKAHFPEAFVPRAHPGDGSVRKQDLNATR